MAFFYERNKVKKSLRLSVLDGSAFSAMLGFTQNYLTPFALALKATTFQIGLLTSLPNFATAAPQLAAPGLAEKAGSRKGFILPMVFIHALTWLPVALIPFVFRSSPVWWLIVLITLGGVFGAIANPAWGSMMADLVPVTLRGRYFGFRTRVTGIVTLAVSFIAGGILQIFSGNVMIGFAILFGGAAVCRFFSLFFLTGMYEPPISKQEYDHQNLLLMVKQSASTNLGRFTLYVALINFATNLSSPFFAVYMLSDLKFSYTAYIINVSFFSIAVLAVQTFWGRRADLAGNIKIITITSFMIPLVPLVWLLSSNFYFLILAQIFSGFAWGGFNLASVNFVYDSSEMRSRSSYIAFFNVITGVALSLGALLGGYLIPYLPPIFGIQILTLFVISGLLRAVVAIFLLRFILEVRKVPQVNTFKLLLGRAVVPRNRR